MYLKKTTLSGMVPLAAVKEVARLSLRCQWYRPNMAASVWKCCMTAAVKVKRLSPSFSGKSHPTGDTDPGQFLF